jgi:outer membrane protein assembly factor BamE (lipoprotein component of BamABCDE complex)
MKASAGREVRKLTAGACLAIACLTMPATLLAADRAITSGPFRNASAVVAQLQRGVSTREDVARLLGRPNGHGGMATASFGIVNEDVWYYEDIEMTDLQSSGGAMRINMRQQLLLVFFKGDKFHGYLWTSNVAPGAIR